MTHSAALKFSIETPAGLSLTPSSGEAPKVQVKADADPREFLLEYSGIASAPLKVTVNYFACDDAETFCQAVQQEYLVTLERDRDGGSRRSFGGRGRGTQPPAAMRGRSPQASTQQRMAEMARRLPLFQALDKNADGKLSAEELASASRSLQRLDRDGDGALSGSELRPSNLNQRPR